MRKIIQYMMMALIAVVLASCANDISEESTPTVKSNIRFVVDDFPMFEKPSTRTIGEEDKGKTAWAVGDEICVKLESKELGTQTATLKYNGVKFELQDGNSLGYLEDEPVTAYAYYAPNRKWLNDGNLGYKDGEHDGTAELLEATCTVHYGDDNYIDISFATATRNYSRLRIATMPNKPITVDINYFTPAGSSDMKWDQNYALTSDEKGNAYLYGTFENNSEVTVKYREAPLKTYTFSQATESAKSYALDATVVSLTDEGITRDQIVENVKKELDAGKTYINLMLAPDVDEETLDAIHIGLREGGASQWSINLTLIGCKKIPSGGFMYWKILKSIALPDVTEIAEKAFLDCTGLQKVVLGNLTKVYGKAGEKGIFEGCRTEDIDLVLSKDQKVMNGGETEGGYCWTADITKDYSSEHHGSVFLDYNFKSITCDY
ncbi:hypothetical protein [Segatella copri]|uniref:hypothetical protein n=1 Tax=Segatella copri TaxID=165179 RepID=UPI00294B8898|nr:hypothetical protein [Segatella copri]WOF89007.1 hypothetical protein RJT05_06635 [Segatella copri]WOF95152.1 hypothetical protein RJT10_06770 [Segatella copri]